MSKGTILADRHAQYLELAAESMSAGRREEAAEALTDAEGFRVRAIDALLVDAAIWTDAAKQEPAWESYGRESAAEALSRANALRGVEVAA